MNPTQQAALTQPTPATVAAQQVGQSRLDKLLYDTELALTIAAGVGGAIPGIGTAIAGGATLALKIESIIQAGLTAHQAITGQPLDLNKLQPYIPV